MPDTTSGTAAPERSEDPTGRPWTRSADEILHVLHVDPDTGLSSGEVDTMRERFGANRVAEQKQRPRILLLLDQFNNPLIYILFGAAILTSVVSSVAEAGTIFFVVVFNAIIGYVQEKRAGERLKAVMSMTAPTARVVRRGRQLSIPAEEVVVGDIVLLESGMRVPADLRIVDLHDLSVDESTLTGESVPVIKRQIPSLPAQTPLGDRFNVAYAGTTVRRGRARTVVTAVGEASQIGRITRQVMDAEAARSPLQERLERFGKVMATGIGVIIAIIFGIGLLRGYDPTTMLLTAVGLAVSAIPEGLPIAVTVALSIGVYRMARQNAIVRKMSAVETLGSTTVICSDKTGTLTRNQMTTVAVATDDRVYTLSGSGYDPTGEILDDSGTVIQLPEESPLRWTLRVGLFCTESSFVERDGRRELVGDPTEGAMIAAAEKTGLADVARTRWSSSVLLPFESERMFMISEIDDGSERYLLAKGSVERLLEMCSSQARQEGIRPLDRDWIIERQRQFSRRGLRVIATAYRPVDSPDTFDPATDLHDFVFAGLHGIEDPPREEARSAIVDAHHAGIKVVMITGDHATTAASIARQLDLSDGAEIRTIQSTELESMSDDDLYERVGRTDVYARVAPEHKLRIVRQLQKHHQVVAMTGDGVNDAPALKQADIGVAMGSGTDVAKEASAMVVQDDNFATIVSAIRYGRVMFRNLQHMVLYVLCTSTGGVLTLAASVLLGFPLPVMALQLLWINLVTDGTSTIPLAYEKEHGDIMCEPPRHRHEGLLNWQMGERIIGAGLVMMFGTLIAFELVLGDYHSTALSNDIPADALLHARTVAFTTLALFQIWNVHNSRAVSHSLFRIGLLSNKPLLAVTFLAVGLQVAAVELPFMHPFMQTTNLTAKQWALCLGISGSLVVLIEFRKWIGRMFHRARAHGRNSHLFPPLP